MLGWLTAGTVDCQEDGSVTSTVVVVLEVVTVVVVDVVEVVVETMLVVAAVMAGRLTENVSSVGKTMMLDLADVDVSVTTSWLT